jgi:hypothetical protein
MSIVVRRMLGVGCPTVATNGSRLGEVAEHKTSLVVQTLKFR